MTEELKDPQRTGAATSRSRQCSVAVLDRHQHAHAEALFRAIPSIANHFTASHLQAQAARERKVVEKHLRRFHRDAPRDIWVGAFVHGLLVGACRASAHFSQAAGVLDAGGFPRHAPDPLWVHRYVQHNLNIEAIAVLPEHRTQGIGRAMLIEVERVAAADRDRDLQWLTAFASDAAAVSLFVASGYTATGARTPMPPEAVGGVRTGWSSAVMGDHPEGRNVYKRVQPRS